MKTEIVVKQDKLSQNIQTTWITKSLCILSIQCYRMNSLTQPWNIKAETGKKKYCLPAPSFIGIWPLYLLHFHGQETGAGKIHKGTWLFHPIWNQHREILIHIDGKKFPSSPKLQSPDCLILGLLKCAHMNVGIHRGGTLLLFQDKSPASKYTRLNRTRFTSKVLDNASLCCLTEHIRLYSLSYDSTTSKVHQLFSIFSMTLHLQGLILLFYQPHKTKDVTPKEQRKEVWIQAYSYSWEWRTKGISRNHQNHFNL